MKLKNPLISYTILSNIRKEGDTPHPELIHIAPASAEERERVFLFEKHLAVYKPFTTEGRPDTERSIYLAYKDPGKQHLLGFIDISFTEQHIAHIDGLYVLQPDKDEIISGALAQAGENHAREKQCTRLQAEIRRTHILSYGYAQIFANQSYALHSVNNQEDIVVLEKNIQDICEGVLLPELGIYTAQDARQEVFRRFGAKAEQYFEYLAYYRNKEGEEGARDLITDLLRRETILDTDTIVALEQYRDAGQNVAPENVHKARHILQSFFQSRRRREFLASRDMIVLIYGSIEFADPRNLDGDVLIFGWDDASLTKREQRRLALSGTHSWSTMLYRHWDEQRMFNPEKTNEPQLGFDTIRRIQRELQAKTTGERYEDIALHLAVALTGAPLFLEDWDTHRAIQTAARDIITQDALLCHEVNTVLRECLITRKTRKLQRQSAHASG